MIKASSNQVIKQRRYNKMLWQPLALLLSLVASSVLAQVVIPLDDGFYVIPIKKNRPVNRPVTPPVDSSFNGALDFNQFDYQRKNERINTGFPIGHNLPKARNELFYNLHLDGYAGLPFGSCLFRKETNGNEYDAISGNSFARITRRFSAAESSVCPDNANRDLMRVWGNRNPNLKNVLLKNMTIKNAFRTRNVVDGTIVKTSSALPHTDTFQKFYTGSSKENPDWLVIQDTLIKNSDNSLMVTGGSRFKGGVYHNLRTECDQAFRDDARTRAVNDYLAYKKGAGDSVNDVLNESGGNNPCSNSMGFSSTVPGPMWLIKVSGANRVAVRNENQVVIVVDSQDQSGQPMRITTRDSNRKIVTHPNVRRYATIEAALEEHAKPPFIEYSCAGWASPPTGCETRNGYLN